jgi:hypothetical protein
MPAQRTSTGGKYIPTEVGSIYRRDARFLVRWREDGKTIWRSFLTFEGACAFKRDYVVPFRESRGLPPTAVAPGKRGNGWVYAFQSTGHGEPVKIGWSSDPARRLKDLAAAQTHKLDLMMLVPGGKAVEALVHTHIAEYRLQGEWYSREALLAVTALLWAGVSKP